MAGVPQCLSLGKRNRTNSLRLDGIEERGAIATSCCQGRRESAACLRISSDGVERRVHGASIVFRYPCNLLILLLTQAFLGASTHFLICLPGCSLATTPR